MKNFKISATGLLLVGLISAVALLGCFGNKHPHEAKTQAFLDDEVTTERVQNALASARPGFTNITVTTTNGDVTLTGSVPNASEKQEAERIAQTIHRVKKIDNKIEVLGNPERK